MLFKNDVISIVQGKQFTVLKSGLVWDLTAYRKKDVFLWGKAALLGKMFNKVLAFL